MAAMGLKLVSPPAGEPVTLAEAKAQLRLPADVTEFDGLIAAQVTAARELLEVKTGRQFLTATWRYSLPGFDAPDAEIRLPNPPLVSVTSLEYVGTDGVLATLAADAYEVDADAEPGVVRPAYGVPWPATQPAARAVRVTYVAGYGAAADVPEKFKQAVKLLVAHWFEHAEAVAEKAMPEVPLAVESLARAGWTGEYR